MPLRIDGASGTPRPSRRDEATKYALFGALTSAALGAASTGATSDATSDAAADAAASELLSFTVAVGPIAQAELIATCRVLSATESDAERLLAASAHDIETALEALRRRDGAPLGAAAEAAACALVARCLRDRLARFSATPRGAPRASLDEDENAVERLSHGLPPGLPPGRTRSARLYRAQQEALLVDALAHYEARSTEERGEDSGGAGSTGEAGSGRMATSCVARAVRNMRRRLLEECPGAAPGDAPRAAAVLHTLESTRRRQSVYSMTAAVLANSADAATALLDGALAPRDLARGLPVGARVALCGGRSDAASIFDVLVHLSAKVCLLFYVPLVTMSFIRIILLTVFLAPGGSHPPLHLILILF